VHNYLAVKKEKALLTIEKHRPFIAAEKSQHKAQPPQILILP
jgi:hypothetical protein